MSDTTTVPPAATRVATPDGGVHEVQPGTVAASMLAGPATPPEPGIESKPDLDVIVPAAGHVTIIGVDCTVRRLKTREFLRLVQVITAGMGPALGQIHLDLSDPESVQEDLLAVMLIAIPNAVEEFTLFLREVVDPVDRAQQGAIATYLTDNPDPAVLLDVFEVVATQEQDDLVALAGKAQAMWSRISRLYQRPNETSR